MNGTGRRWNAALKFSAAAIAVVIVAAAVWVGVTRDWSAGDGGSSDRADDQSLGLKMFPKDERVAVPAISGMDLDGKPLALTDYPGQVLVLNVWGSWCGPCRAEAPDLAKVSNATHGDGVQFIGIDTRDSPAAAKSFESEFGIEYPSFDDRDGRVLTQFNGLVPIAAVPSTIFIDTDGLIAARVIGRVDQTTLQGIVDDLLKEPAPRRPDA